MCLWPDSDGVKLWHCHEDDLAESAQQKKKPKLLESPQTTV